MLNDLLRFDVKEKSWGRSVMAVYILYVIVIVMLLVMSSLFTLYINPTLFVALNSTQLKFIKTR